MKILSALFAAFFFTTLNAEAKGERLFLTCSVQIQQKTVIATYAADRSRMVLTDFEDGTSAGESFGGHLKLSLDGKIIYDGPAEGTNEEYGVIVDHSHMTYVSLNIPDGTMNMTFGKSFEDEHDVYWTDSARKEIGGNDFAESYPASCVSGIATAPLASIAAQDIQCKVAEILDAGDFENVHDFTFVDYPFVSFETQTADGKTLHVGAMSFSENDSSQPSKISITLLKGGIEISAEPEESGQRYTLRAQGKSGTFEYAQGDSTSRVARLVCE